MMFSDYVAPEVVSGRAVTVETLVRSQASLCEICGGRSDTGTVFLESASFPTALCDSTSDSLYQETNM